MKNYKKEDLRIIRSRKLLATALFDLMETTPFEKITVMDICDKAMVHRATFYNHFDDKEHLLEYAIDAIKEELFDATTSKESFDTDKQMYMALVSNCLNFVQDKRDKLVLILNQNKRSKVAEIMNTALKRSLQYLMGKMQTKERLKVPSDILVDFISGGLTNLGLEFLENPKQYSKDDFIKYIDILLDERAYVKGSSF